MTHSDYSAVGGSPYKVYGSRYYILCICCIHITCLTRDRNFARGMSLYPPGPAALWPNTSCAFGPLGAWKRSFSYCQWMKRDQLHHLLDSANTFCTSMAEIETDHADEGTQRRPRRECLYYVVHVPVAHVSSYRYRLSPINFVHLFPTVSDVFSVVFWQ